MQLEYLGMKWGWREKFVDGLGGAFMPDLFVVSAIGEYELLVFTQERSGIDTPFIPEQHRPAPSFRDPHELQPCFLQIEPVSSLRSDDKVNAVVWQSRSFGCARDAGESRITSKEFFTSL